MPIYPFDDKAPRAGARVFIAPSADVIGDVELGDDVDLPSVTSTQRQAVLGPVLVGRY
ncbi:hypothetical protein KKF84_18750 [Myxococcota bacterium]|nr:hypothetical protein [Myxococcota bacterium]